MYLLFLLLLLLNSIASKASMIITLGSSLNPINNSYWSSDSGHFAFGFYPQGRQFSIGIFMPSIQQKTVIWTANPNDPPLSRNATLILDLQGRLTLRGGEQISIANTLSPASSASMLDSGNFVLYDSDSNIIWQTFDVPTDTILPGQRLLAGKQLVSTNSDGRFGLRMRTNGNLIMHALNYPFKTDYFYWRSRTNAGDNVTLNLDTNGQLFLLSTNGVKLKTLNIDSRNISGKAMYRATVDSDGIFRLYSHNLGKFSNWSIEWQSSNNKCDPTGICGQNSYCSVAVDQNPVCTCLPSFDFIDDRRKNFGCQWNSITNGCAGGKEWNFSFQEVENVSWETSSQYSTLQSATKEACRDDCFRDCDCEAAIYTKQQCSKLKFPLMLGKMQQIEQTTFIKTSSRLISSAERNAKTTVLIICIVVSTCALVMMITFGILFYRFRVWNYRKISNSSQGNDELFEDVTLRAFTYEELKNATNNFEDEIGRGGFGTVYRGLVSNGSRVVAIKRLQKVMAEGEREFRNEMRIIGRTHHKSLVRLLGYCHDETHRLLVYEYMKNGSLADFLFRRAGADKADWEGRIEIAIKIARGIVYLHEECETQIIHCDIKPENILMDENEWPKIADFGLSKLLMPDQSMTYTGVRGTRGYVAPEWHSNAPITVKVDVYSFGIMLLEIICCRRNVEMDVEDDEVVLANWVYKCFEGKELYKITKEKEVEETEVERIVKVGLWCIQDEPSLRPSMNKVVLMLDGTIDTPQPPASPSFSTATKHY
ncbi:G-type lectin S-receptor-like serine/threonine-protein kinase LECRK3 [Euphorbia lathyris]|uniref:G-type lectin S-receptor-like serine/threonine-protein kinase LECRK3 n=1 Tax=Euphorbia lathyris TaxID=212925 RepID=UPI0033138E7C